MVVEIVDLRLQQLQNISSLLDLKFLTWIYVLFVSTHLRIQRQELDQEAIFANVHHKN